MFKLHCQFIPQVWMRDYAVAVDADGPVEWDVIVDRLPEPHSYDSDALRESDNAPAWVREYPGPFEVEYEVC